MGCCIIALIGAAWPRIALVIIYFVAPAIPQKAFHSLLWPLVGFFLMPTTTLAYELCSYYMQGGTTNLLSIIIIALAALHDLGQLGPLGRRRRET
jgi:hypothetical protein